MLEKLKEIIADQLNVDADSITAESRFKEDRSECLGRTV